MAIQKITSSQVAAPTGATAGFVLTSTGAGATPTFQALPASTSAIQETKSVTVTTVGISYTLPTFSFVVGLIFFELYDDITTDANQTNCLASGFAVMRPLSGSKTANTTRKMMVNAQGGTGPRYSMVINRTSTGTVLAVDRVQGGSTANFNGTGLSTFADLDWPTGAVIRITAIEDTQS